MLFLNERTTNYIRLATQHKVISISVAGAKILIKPIHKRR
jgi:hypothetical protein